ncbi:MAG: DUF2752 domain-containing protein [Saprospiraceae bacterium]
MTRSQLYRIMALACLAGYVWLAILLSNSGHSGHDMDVCLIRKVTDTPCPSCGSSRAVLAIIHGDFLAALKFNPFGYLISGILLISPVWILFDMIFAKNSFLIFYKQVENHIRNKWIAIPMIVLVIANWIWNILKDV